jgi:hypothetical protein
MPTALARLSRTSHLVPSDPAALVAPSVLVELRLVRAPSALLTASQPTTGPFPALRQAGR